MSSNPDTGDGLVTTQNLSGRPCINMTVFLLGSQVATLRRCPATTRPQRTDVYPLVEDEGHRCTVFPCIVRSVPLHLLDGRQLLGHARGSPGALLRSKYGVGGLAGVQSQSL